MNQEDEEQSWEVKGRTQYEAAINLDGGQSPITYSLRGL